MKKRKQKKKYINIEDIEYKSRNLTSDSARHYVYSKQDGKCNACGEKFKIDQGEFDHIIPHAIIKETKIGNIQFLCNACHKEKTRKDLVEIKESKMSKEVNSPPIDIRADIEKVELRLEDHFEAEGLEKFRPIQIEAIINGFSDIIRNNLFCIIASGASGKTLSTIAILYVLYCKKQIGHAIVISPYTDVAQSFINEKTLNTFVKLFKPTNKDALKKILTGDTLTRNVKDLKKDKVGIYACTQQYMSRPMNLKLTSRLIKKAEERTIVVVDEVHHSSEENVYGNVIETMKEVGAYIGANTATPRRGPNERIAGLIYEEITDPREIEMLDNEYLYAGKKPTGEYYRLVPSVYYSYKKAVSDGYVLPITKHAIDFDVIKKINGEMVKTGRVSELSPAESAKWMSANVRTDLVRETLIEKGLELLFNQKKKSKGKPIMMVTCAHDVGEIPNEELKKVKAFIEKRHPELKVEIVTSKEDGDVSTETLKVVKDANEGKIDVIITKQCLTVGTDIPAISTIVDLSVIRSEQSLVQKLYRAVRLYMEFENCCWVCVDDVVGRQRYDLLLDTSDIIAGDVEEEVLIDTDDDAEPSTADLIEFESNHRIDSAIKGLEDLIPKDWYSYHKYLVQKMIIDVTKGLPEQINVMESEALSEFNRYSRMGLFNDIDYNTWLYETFLPSWREDVEEQSTRTDYEEIPAIHEAPSATATVSVVNPTSQRAVLNTLVSQLTTKVSYHYRDKDFKSVMTTKHDRSVTVDGKRIWLLKGNHHALARTAMNNLMGVEAGTFAANSKADVQEMIRGARIICRYLVICGKAENDLRREYGIRSLVVPSEELVRSRVQDEVNGRSELKGRNKVEKHTIDDILDAIFREKQWT